MPLRWKVDSRLGSILLVYFCSFTPWVEPTLSCWFSPKATIPFGSSTPQKIFSFCCFYRIESTLFASKTLWNLLRFRASAKKVSDFWLGVQNVSHLKNQQQVHESTFWQQLHGQLTHWDWTSKKSHCSELNCSHSYYSSMSYHSSQVLPLSTSDLNF